MYGNIKSVIKLVLIAVWVGFWYPLAWLAYRFQKISYRDKMSVIFNRGLLKIIGIKLVVSGEATQDRPLLLVSNHVSYLDIPIIAAQTAVCFTPKIEIASWPLIGSITRVSGALFIDRRPEKVLEFKKALHNTLASGRIVCLFPEATTGNGLRLQPFKSGFFSLADEPIEGQRLTIQPACIAYTHISGLPIDSAQWPNIAWYGDMILAPHAWELMQLGPIKVHLTFLPPITPKDGSDRKQIAAECHQLIGNTLQETRMATTQNQSSNPAKPISHHFRKGVQGSQN